MPLFPGTQLAHYEILEPIGKGGMGEVYRARDGKLGRDVAIKVLPEEFAQDTERLRRFQREAKVLASLNHPNIASIYGLEQSDSTHYLVLELVPGETLAERIARGPIPVDEALEIAKKIAEALEEAHEQGIVHRDLKPANIKQTEDGKIKVLDFGLAKAFVDDAAEADSSMSPTLTRDATRVGVILGTAAYMSPEQAKGKQVDKRADVWAFGVVLYEMLTGKRAFAGEDVSETLAYVLTKEPGWGALPPKTPNTIRQVLELCLTKDVKRRVRDIGDVRLVMDGAFGIATAAASPKRTIGWRMAAVAALGIVALVWLVLLRTRAPVETQPVMRFRTVLPSTVSLSPVGRHALALSPDATQLVFVANDQLYLREMDALEATPLKGTADAGNPFFSPDGQWVGFWSEGQLKKVSIGGGAPVTLCETSNPLGASWGPDDTIVFGQRQKGIWKVSANGGEATALITLDSEKGERAHGPELLPGGRTVLFTLVDRGDSSVDVPFANWDEARIVAQSLETGQRRLLVERGTDARYVPTGHLVYAHAGSLLAVPFDRDSLEVTGAPIEIAEGIQMAVRGSGTAHFSFSRNGSLVYYASSFARVPLNTLVTVDRSGAYRPLTQTPRAHLAPRFSPDGKRLAVTIYDEGSAQRDIWLVEMSRASITRLTFDDANSTDPIWSPDGRTVTFASDRAGRAFNIFSKDAGGVGDAVQLSAFDEHTLPKHWTEDGSQLVFVKGGTFYDIGVFSPDGSGEVDMLVAEPSRAMQARLSPDERWLAFTSDESGQREVYVQAFRGPKRRWQVSTDGGSEPVWAPNERELFYRNNDKMMVTPIATQPEFRPGVPTVLFEGRYAFDPFGNADTHNYDVASDSQHFVMLLEDERVAPGREIVFVVDWFQELERLVPTDN